MMISGAECILKCKSHLSTSLRVGFNIAEEEFGILVIANEKPG